MFWILMYPIKTASREIQYEKQSPWDTVLSSRASFCLSLWSQSYSKAALLDFAHLAVDT